MNSWRTTSRRIYGSRKPFKARVLYLGNREESKGKEKQWETQQHYRNDWKKDKKKYGTLVKYER